LGGDENSSSWWYSERKATSGRKRKNSALPVTALPLHLEQLGNLRWEPERVLQKKDPDDIKRYTVKQNEHRKMQRKCIKLVRETLYQPPVSTPFLP